MTDQDQPGEAPPPVPPPEMPKEALAALIDQGEVLEIERALREQNVRLPAVLAELDRVLDAGLGNLATVLATMLISSFHLARAGQIAERILAQKDTAGVEELTDLAAALMLEERLTTAGKVLTAALEHDPRADRALYLSAKLEARRGQLDRAFSTIAKVSPKLLGGSGLATQARWAALLGKNAALEAAWRLAQKAAQEEDREHLNFAAGVIHRQRQLGRTPPYGLRTAFAVEYGSILVELAKDPKDGGRFGMQAMTPFDVGRLLDRMVRVWRNLGVLPKELLYATEDGEIVATGLGQRLAVPVKEVRHDRPIVEGAWYCMASAGTHPHVANPIVRVLHEALNAGVLRSAALILPAGWRAPLVPDLIGRITGDDELPWGLTDEVDETLERMLDDSEGATDDWLDDGPALEAHLEGCAGLFRALQPEPRPGHVPYLDETPVPRAP
ncbi:MAG: hypothetical protein IPG45_15405 [Deltaproteobacteria bacterium]|nr:hypothetical protein [Deltaproteobacteria bacterium]